MGQTGSMRALFVMDPLSTVHVDRDSSYVLMLEWQARGGEVWHCLWEDCWIEDGEYCARASRLQVGPRPKVADVLETATLRGSSLTAVFKRTDPPFDIGYIFSTYMLDIAAQHAVVVNDPAGLRDANEKMVILRYPDLIPPTLVTRDMARIKAFVAEVGGKAVLKPWDGNGGRGIFVAKTGDRNFNSILETSTLDGRLHVMVQAFVEAVDDTGDKRIILVDGVPKGAFARIPPADDYRGNMHVGATVQRCEMTPRDLHICERLQPYLADRGMIFTGIDVIGDWLTEVNVTSPTGIQECTSLYGTRIDVDIIDAVLARRSA
jgi:glutathione synthase